MCNATFSRPRVLKRSKCNDFACGAGYHVLQNRTEYAHKSKQNRVGCRLIAEREINFASRRIHLICLHFNVR